MRAKKIIDLKNPRIFLDSQDRWELEKIERNLSQSGRLASWDEQKLEEIYQKYKDKIW